MKKNHRVICNKCGKAIKDMPFKCKYCGKYYCSEHRLPEDHGCKKLSKTKKWKIHKTSSKFKPPKIRSSSTKRYIPSTTNYESEEDMYQPSKNGSSFNFFKKLGLKDLAFKVPRSIQPYLERFLLVFIIGLVLNFVYYQTFSLQYLFIGGVNDWFRILMTTMNGAGQNYDFFYLIINGFYYFYFYSAFALLIFKIIENLNKKKTWVMLGWIGILIYIAIRFFLK